MTVEELKDMIDFAVRGIEKRTDKNPSVLVLLKIKFTDTPMTVLLNVKEVGFDDITATIFIEV
jgi:hypothetical protein